MLTPQIDITVVDTKVFSKQIIVADLSDWGAIVNEPSIMEVTYNEETNYVGDFGKGRYNRIDSLKMFGEVNESLPDGLYKITVKGSPDIHKKTIYYFRTDDLRQRFGYIYLSEKGDANLIDKIYEVFIMLESIKLLVCQGNITRAREKYETAIKIIEVIETSYECKYIDC